MLLHVHSVLHYFVLVVCRVANKNCQLVFDAFKHCWDSTAGEDAKGGIGLMNGYYDGCSGKFNGFTRCKA